MMVGQVPVEEQGQALINLAVAQRRAKVTMVALGTFRVQQATGPAVAEVVRTLSARTLVAIILVMVGMVSPQASLELQSLMLVAVAGHPPAVHMVLGAMVAVAPIRQERMD